jgi:16S rRNA (uracil1498-N3)-methyltransferase
VVDVADGAGTVARSVVQEVTRDRLTVLVSALERQPASVPRLVLVQALAKGGRDELAVETATELGVDAVVPWQAERCVVVWAGERGERSRRRWEETVRAAAKQSRRAWVPVVEPLVSTRTLAADVAATVGGDGLVLVLHEGATCPLTGVALPGPASSGDVLVVVGPEGGISDAELADLAGAGGQVARLGPSVLRSSSAGAAALAVLSARLGRWD